MKITAIIVSQNNGWITYYSILSIVKIVNEILYFDDSKIKENRNQLIYDLAQECNNIKIINNPNFGHDLGKKKDYLRQKASNNIIMRWDDDFILSDLEILKKFYLQLANNKTDIIICRGKNVAYDYYHSSKNKPFWGPEPFIFTKNAIKFLANKRYSAFPNTMKGKRRLKSKDICFIHLWNLKPLDWHLYRKLMNPFMLNKRFNNYYQFYFWSKTRKIGSGNDIKQFIEKELKSIKDEHITDCVPLENKYQKHIPHELIKKVPFQIVKPPGANYYLHINKPLSYRKQFPFSIS